MQKRQKVKTNKKMTKEIPKYDKENDKELKRSSGVTE